MQLKRRLITVKYGRNAYPTFTDNWVNIDLSACPVEAVKTKIVANEKLWGRVTVAKESKKACLLSNGKWWGALVLTHHHWTQRTTLPSQCRIGGQCIRRWHSRDLTRPRALRCLQVSYASARRRCRLMRNWSHPPWKIAWPSLPGDGVYECIVRLADSTRSVGTAAACIKMCLTKALQPLGFLSRTVHCHSALPSPPSLFPFSPQASEYPRHRL